MPIAFNPAAEPTSVNNSTTANLAASASFTGTADRIDGWEIIGIMAFCNQPLSIQVQQSPDGTNWDIVDTYTVTASVGDARQFEAIGGYFRIIVTNTGGSTSAALRVQTIFSSGGSLSPRALGQQVMSKSLPVVLPSDQILNAVVANSPTNTANYSIAKQGTSVNTTEVPFVLIKNPSGSGKSIYIASIFLQSDPSEAGNWSIYQIYANPTVTANGTAITPQNNTIGAGNASIATPFYSSTVSANGALLGIVQSGGNNNGPTFTGSVILPEQPIVIPPNNSMLVTAKAKGNGTLCNFWFQWWEI